MSHSVTSLLTYPPLGSISAVSRVRSLILREESSFGGSVRAHFPEQRLVIEPNPPPHLKKGGWTQASPHFLYFLTKATWQPSSKDKTKTIIISVNPPRLWIIFSVAEMWGRLGLIILYLGRSDGSAGSKMFLDSSEFKRLRAQRGYWWLWEGLAQGF